MTNLRFRTVAFDLDGTLADTAPDLTAALNHSLEELSFPPVCGSLVRHSIGHGARALLRKGLATAGQADEDLVEAGFPIFMRFYEDHICDLTRPFPGVNDVLDKLDSMGIALAVCTNKPTVFTDRLLQALGWQDRFAAVIAADTLSVRKPSPETLRAAIDRAGGGPGAFVGDSIVDAQTARAAGVPCVAVSFGYSDRPIEEIGADAIIDSYDELIPVLVSL